MNILLAVVVLAMAAVVAQIIVEYLGTMPALIATGSLAFTCLVIRFIINHGRRGQKWLLPPQTPDHGHSEGVLDPGTDRLSFSKPRRT